MNISYYLFKIKNLSVYFNYEIKRFKLVSNKKTRIWVLLRKKSHMIGVPQNLRVTRYQHVLILRLGVQIVRICALVVEELGKL